MSEGAEGPLEGRVRRGRGPLFALGMVLVLIAVWWLGGRSAEERTVDDRPEPSIQVVQDLPPTGRLVYAADATGGPPGRPQRLVVLDLVTGEVREGPFVPVVGELAAVGPDRTQILVVTDLGAEGGAAYLLQDLSPQTVPVEVVRGDLLTVSNRGDGVVAARTTQTEGATPDGEPCEGTRFEIARVAPLTGLERVAVRGSIVCGRVLSVAVVSAQAYASLLDDGVVRTGAASGGEFLSYIFGGGALVSAGPDGSWVTVQGDREGWPVLEGWPHTPVGTFLWSRGPSPGRPLTVEPRIVGERVVAWSRDGDEVVIVGTVDGERSMWLVTVEGGAAVRLFPMGSVPPRAGSSGASFDAEDRVFAVSDGVLTVATSGGVSGSVDVLLGAPRPSGPVAWLP